MLHRVMSRLSVENFLSHSTEAFRRGTLLCCASENCWERKSLWKRNGERGVSKVSVEHFLSQTAETIRRETLYSFNSFGVSKMFMLQRVMSQFSVDLFCLTVPNHFVEEPFCAVFHKISGREKVYGKEGGGGSIDVFRRKFFVSKCRKVS